MPISHAVPGSAMLMNIELPGFAPRREAPPAGQIDLLSYMRSRKKKEGEP